MKPYILPTTAQVAVKMNQQLLQNSGPNNVQFEPGGEKDGDMN